MNIAVLPQRLLSRIVDRLLYSLYLIKMLDCITFSYYKGEIANTNLRVPQRCVTERERGNNRTTPTVDYNQGHTRKKTTRTDTVHSRTDSFGTNTKCPSQRDVRVIESQNKGSINPFTARVFEGVL